MNDLWKLTAMQVVDLLNKKQVSPLELIDGALERIGETDNDLNALPTVCSERARSKAKELMAQPPPDPVPTGYLYGLPVAVKDLKDVAGVRSTKGSTISADHIPERSDYMVETIEAKGGIVLAKSNTPEFGAGANTFNEVFGKTRNPWDLSKTCGGSSGGSAVALATGQVWLATGSDLGGSLRLPASFCSVVGLRPSPGRIATGPKRIPFATLSVEGPMARNVGDVALLLDAMAGLHPGDPISIPAPERSYTEAVNRPAVPRRVAFSPDLGIAPVDREVREICSSAARLFEGIGAVVEEDSMDLADAGDVFQTLRAAQFVASYSDLLENHREQLKPEVIWNIEKGHRLSAEEIARAELARGAIFHRAAEFFQDYDLLLCPAASVPPFDVDVRYPTEINGVQMDNYIAWVLITSAITLTACPAISVPCGFTRDGLPVGLQIVGPRGREDLVLGAAALFEESTGVGEAVPIDPHLVDAKSS